MSTAYERPDGMAEPVTTPAAQPAMEIGPARLVPIGLLTLLVAAWGGIVPFVGPVFGFSADGSGSWTWDLSHAVLGLVPGAVGVFAGFCMLSLTGRTARLAGRTGLAGIGILAMAAGAWFVIGPWALPVMVSTPVYFALASPLTGLAHVIGYSFGPGLILAACGGMAMGWALRSPAVSAPPAERHLRLHRMRQDRAQEVA